MNKDITEIVDHLISTADLICLDNSKDGGDFDEANADVARFCLSQQSDEGRDKVASGILKEHKMTVADLKFLDKAGVLINEENEDAPGSIIDDRTLHVSVWLADAKKFSTIDQRHWNTW